MSDPRVSAILEELPAMIDAAGGVSPLMNGNCGVLCCALLRRLQERGMHEGVEVIIGISQEEYENETQDDFDTFGFNDICSEELRFYEEIDGIGTVHMALLVGDVVIDAEGVSDLKKFHHTITTHALDYVDFLCVGFREGDDVDEVIEYLASFVSRTTANSLEPEDLLEKDICPAP